MGELTEEAKAAIAEAVRIVREDKLEAFVRDRLTKHTTPPDPKPTDPPNPDKPPTDPNNPPPPDPKPTDPPPNPNPEGEKSAWWGEIIRD